MKIKKIIKVKGVGILHDFNCSKLQSPDLDFKNINLIFGWNGTGKTTFSRVLRCYEIGDLCTKLKKYTGIECDIELNDGSRLSHTDFFNKQQIRVFNKDFIEENIFQDREQDGGNVKAIFYLGKEKIELKKERSERDEKKEQIKSIILDIKEKERLKEKFTVDTAKEIKDALLGVKEFQFYNRSNFVESFDTLAEKVNRDKIVIDNLKISENDFEKKLKAVKNFDSLKVWIDDIKRASAYMSSSFIETLEHILGKSVSLQKTIEKLKTDYELSSWVRSGIKIHKDRASTECEFCGQELPNNRIDDLEQHFNKEYTDLVNEVSTKIKELKALKVEGASRIPDEDTKKLTNTLNSLLDKLIEKLEKKQRNVIESYFLTKDGKAEFINGFKEVNISSEAIAAKVSNIAKELEISLIANHFNEYKKRSDDIGSTISKKNALENEIDRLDKAIKSGEKAVRDFKFPADEINKDLEKFLGHSELKFEDREDEYKEVYYEIKRNNDVAFNLSEGEKTAISLVYFLRKLGEDGFDLANGLVFIDDPISSMDSQFLYAAYAFIVATIEDETGTNLLVGQFFLSTHNYDFFNLFKEKYWNSRKKPAERRCDLYMLRVEIDSVAGRCSSICELDKLLKNFNSDYQYLFSRLVEFEKATEAEQSDLQRIYFYPNIARRVLETFLSFKFPAKTDFQAKLNAVIGPNVTKQMKESVYRFVNLKSHGTIREAEGFSAEILEPSAKDHVLDVLKIMRETDPGHCNEIESSIS